MYREEKIINGILHYRTNTNGDFKPCTLQYLTNKIEMLKEMEKQQQENIYERERFRAIDFAKWFSHRQPHRRAEDPEFELRRCLFRRQ